jgi:hypothetical protein
MSIKTACNYEYIYITSKMFYNIFNAFYYINLKRNKWPLAQILMIRNYIHRNNKDTSQWKILITSRFWTARNKINFSLMQNMVHCIVLNFYALWSLFPKPSIPSNPYKEISCGLWKQSMSMRKLNKHLKLHLKVKQSVHYQFTYWMAHNKIPRTDKKKTGKK